MPVKKPYDPTMFLRTGGGGGVTGPTGPTGGPGPTGPTGASGSSQATSLARTLPGPLGLVNPQLVYITGTGAIALAAAGSDATARAVGVVLSSPAPGSYIVQIAGEVPGFSGLTPGARYILSLVAGDIVEDTDTANPNYPDTTGEVWQLVGIATSATTLLLQTQLVTTEITN